MARIIIGTLLCIWGLGMMLAVILEPEEFEGRPLLGLLATSLVFIIPGIILIYFGRKARKIKNNQNDKKYIQTDIARGVNKVEADKKSNKILYPPIQKQKKVKNNSREEIIQLINEIINYADSITLITGAQEVRITKLTKYGHDFISDIEIAIRTSIRIGNPEYIYINAGLLCEAIGKMKGANAFTILSNLLTSETDIKEYKYIRFGAIRGLMQLGNRRAITLLRELKNPNISESTIDEAIKFIESKSITVGKPDAKLRYLTKNDFDKEYSEGKCPVCGMWIELKNAKTRTDYYQYFNEHIYTIDYFCPKCFDDIDYMKGWLVDVKNNKIRYKEN